MRTYQSLFLKNFQPLLQQCGKYSTRSPSGILFDWDHLIMFEFPAAKGAYNPKTGFKKLAKRQEQAAKDHGVPMEHMGYGNHFEGKTLPDDTNYRKLILAHVLRALLDCLSETSF